jgi:hypothetical protein
MPTHTGTCLCGTVRFEVQGDFERFYLCHCRHCRKDTGSAHAANLFSTTARLRWLGGEDHIARFQLPGTRHSKSWCTTCGSALPELQLDGTLLKVPAGSLDTEVPNTPDAHLFTASRAGWDHALERIPMIEGLPE